jgi:hypothetical protein
MMFNKEFWLEATERAIKTLAQFIIVLGSAGALNVFTVDWQTNIGLALGGALLSYATSIVSAGINKNDTPSLVDFKGEKND